MEQQMQYGDFLALCKGPVPVFVSSSLHIPANIRSKRIETHWGMGYFNRRRIIQDWFPAGEIFVFLGATCFSRGLAPGKVGEPPELLLLAPARTGGVEEVRFGIKEVMSLARQVSVDRFNTLREIV